MRRWLIILLGPLLLAALAPLHSASAAEPRVGPRLTLSFTDGDPASIIVAGRQCVPLEDAPASVLLTADWVPDHVFTATPDSTGRWSVVLPQPAELEGTHSINAECDAYFGTMTYPESGFGVLAVSATAPAGGTNDGSGGGLANTGSDAGIAAVGGAVLLALGAGCVWLGRRRGARGE